MFVVSFSLWHHACFLLFFFVHQNDINFCLLWKNRRFWFLITFLITSNPTKSDSWPFTVSEEKINMWYSLENVLKKIEYLLCMHDFDVVIWDGINDIRQITNSVRHLCRKLRQTLEIEFVTVRFYFMAWIISHIL